VQSVFNVSLWPLSNDFYNARIFYSPLSWYTFWQPLVLRQPNHCSVKSCFYHIRDLRRIRDTLDFSASCTIATSLVHSKLDYCNFLYKFSHITPTLKSLHWLKVRERMSTKFSRSPTIPYKFINHLTYLISTFAAMLFCRDWGCILSQCLRRAKGLSLLIGHLKYPFTYLIRMMITISIC